MSIFRANTTKLNNVWDKTKLSSLASLFYLLHITYINLFTSGNIIFEILEYLSNLSKSFIKIYS